MGAEFGHKKSPSRFSSLSIILYHTTVVKRLQEQIPRAVVFFPRTVVNSMILGGAAMRIAIVEDRQDDMERLRELIAAEGCERGWTCAVEPYPSGEAFLAAAGPFDIVFLDVILGGIDGLETARRFRANGGSAPMVFVTVEAGFAVDGYDVEASAFLVKPARPERLRGVLDRLARKPKEDVLVALSSDVELPAGVILSASAADHYLKVHTAAKPYFPALSMVEFRARLPDDGRFAECSRGVVVNLDHITKVDARIVLLDDGTRLPVSRRKRTALVEAIAARTFKSARKGII